MSTPARYKAFISYSHADEAWATWLHKALEAYRVPTKLVGRESPVGAIPKKLFPIFKDRDELASAHQLGSELEKALHDSASLIVLCSPRAAQSKWVNEEIKLYKAMGRAERVFCLIVDGEPGDADRECFPEAARFQVDDAGQITDLPAEPIAADVRAGGDGKTDAKLKLIAGILGVGFNELKQRELAARNRRLTALASVASVIAVITVGLAILAVQARDEAHAQRQIAEARQGQAEGLIQFMLGDLREKLEPIGKLDILDAVGEQAMAYFGQVSPETLSDTELAARAQALRQIGDVRVQQGKLADASPAFREALRLDEELVRRQPADQQSIFNMAQSEFYIGYDLYLRSQYEQARTWFVRYDRSADRLNELAPENLDWQREKAYALDNLATVLTRLDLHRDCQTAAGAAADTATRILLRRPGDDATRRVLASNYIKAGTCAGAAGDSAAHIEFLQQALVLAEQRLASDPQAVAFRRDLAIALDSLVAPLVVSGHLAQAAAHNDKARIHWDALATSDPSNARHKEFLLNNRRAAAEILILEDRGSEALPIVESALSFIDSTDAVADEALSRYHTSLRLHTLRLMLLAPQERRIALVEEANALGSQLSRGLAQFTTRDPREQIACLQLPTEIKVAACNTAIAAQLPNPADPLHAVVRAMREATNGQPLAQSAAARTLAERNYHGAEWHLFKRRHTAAGFHSRPGASP